MSVAKKTAALPSSFDAQHLEILLMEGGEAMGVELSIYQVRQIITYLSLLSKWNTVYNLTAIRSPETMMTHHILDSLAVADAIKETGNLLDVGSGAGLPGIVLAVMCPEMQVSLVDAVRKKTAFLSQVKAELQLKNVTVHAGRVEKLRFARKFDAIISRAFSDLSTFVAVSGHHLSDSGYFYAMKGILPEGEIDALSTGLKLKAVIPLKVPFLDAKRHLLILEKSAV